MKKSIITIVIVILITAAMLVVQRGYSVPTVSISKEQIESFLKNLPPEEIAKLKENPKGKDEITKAIRHTLAIGQEAKRRGITELPDVKGTLELARNQLLIKSWKRIFGEKADLQVTKEEIDEFYKKDPKAFSDFLNRNPEIRKNFAAMDESKDEFKEIKKQYAEMCIQKNRAEKAGVANAPEFEIVWLFSQARVVMDKLLPELEKQVKVPEPEIKLYYNNHLIEFEEVRVSHILIATQQMPSGHDTSEKQEQEPHKVLNKNEAQEKALALLKRIQNGEDFGKIASENSDDPGSKDKGGDLGFFRKGVMAKQFEDTAFSLKPGEVSSIIETPYGIHIIKGLEKRTAVFDKYISEEITSILKQQKLDELLDTVATENHVVIPTNFQFPN